MNLRSTTASFTVSDEPWALLSCANLPTDSAFYDIRVRRLTVLLQASSPQGLAALQLPFANNYSIFNQRYWGSLIGDFNPMSSPRGIDYPTGFMPLPGVHKKMQTDAKNARLILAIVMPYERIQPIQRIR